MWWCDVNVVVTFHIQWFAFWLLIQRANLKHLVHQLSRAAHARLFWFLHVFPPPSHPPSSIHHPPVAPYPVLMSQSWPSSDQARAGLTPGTSRSGRVPPPDSKLEPIIEPVFIRWVIGFHPPAPAGRHLWVANKQLCWKRRHCAATTSEARNNRAQKTVSPLTEERRLSERSVGRSHVKPGEWCLSARRHLVPQKPFIAILIFNLFSPPAVL